VDGWPQKTHRYGPSDQTRRPWAVRWQWPKQDAGRFDPTAVMRLTLVTWTRKRNHATQPIHPLYITAATALWINLKTISTKFSYFRLRNSPYFLRSSNLRRVGGIEDSPPNRRRQRSFFLSFPRRFSAPPPGSQGSCPLRFSVNIFMPFIYLVWCGNG
jgi:hypothetical protein